MTRPWIASARTCACSVARWRMLIAGGVVAGAGAIAAQPAPEAFTDAEIARILAHGPWPSKLQPDPSNRVSGNAYAIAFGERLFFDTRLSANGRVSCATCHQPGKFFTDGEARSSGLARSDRNAPSLVDLRGRRWFGWDGAHDSLWSQSIRPLLDSSEMGMSARSIASLVRREPDLSCHFRRAFGAAPPEDDLRVLADVGKALAAFQETLVSSPTPFDAFREALARGDRAGMASYPDAAKRGLRIFVGRGGCNNCHTGAAFSNGEFHDIGLRFFTGRGRVDAGRHAGIERLKGDPFNLLGPYNDDASRTTATSTRHVVQEHRNFGEFRVPSLRNVAGTAPYMHDGSLATLDDVVRHYSEIDEDRLHVHGERILEPLRFSDAEGADLVAFLRTLGDGIGAFRLAERNRSPCDPR